MIEWGIVGFLLSLWVVGVVLVEKKDGIKRFCVDYRFLNSKIVKDVYFLLRIDDLFDCLRGVYWFCILDFYLGFWQVEMDEVDKQKIVFVMRNGLF